MSKAVDFQQMGPDALADTLVDAPDFQRFSPAMRRAIRTIHALPSLFDGATLDEIEIYVGRTAMDPQALRGRWRCHEERRRHQFGVVLFTCPTDRVRAWERAANRLVKRLDERRALCVANITAGSQGPLPAADTSCIYLTWRFRSPRRCAPLGRSAIDDLVDEVRVPGPTEPSARAWRKALAPLPTVQDRIHLLWSHDRPPRGATGLS